MAQQQEEKKEESQRAPKKMNALFSEINKFKTDKLKPTETVVRHLVTIVDKGKGAGPDSALDDEEIKEFYDSEEVLQEKAEKLAKLISQSKYTVVHTGAGISTAAKLPDYRGMQYYI